jgi:phosphoribosylanthranilate isomerase
MIDGIRFKVCGLTSLVDAEFADRCGADFLGFIFHAKSPRGITTTQYAAMAARLPDRRKVAVSVEPTDERLAELADLGFDCFQIHHRPELAPEQVRAWAKRVGRDRLWLAPKVAPGAELPGVVLAAARTILVDTYHAEGFGGSGQTGDWGRFARLQAVHPDNTWILAGGLNPENIGDALRGSGTRFVDVNSGVESAPGVKDEAKLKRFVVRLHEAATALRPGTAS